MIRPPEINVDTSSPPSVVRRAPGRPQPIRCPRLSFLASLLAALLEDDDLLLEALAEHVDALLAQVCDGLLREIRAVGGLRGRLLDDLVGLRDRRCPLELDRVHDPDTELVRPDERVDLVHLPALVALRDRWPV